MKSSNEVHSEDLGGGFFQVEIADNNAWKAIAHKDNLLYSSTICRNGSFHLVLPAEETAVAAAATTTNGTEDLKREEPAAATGTAGKAGNEVLGILEYEVDEHVTESVAGVSLPKRFLAPTLVVDELKGKKSSVSVKVVDLDTIILLFPKNERFYILERTGPQSEATPSTPINVVLLTNLVSLIASAIIEGIKHEAMDLIHLIK